MRRILVALLFVAAAGCLSAGMGSDSLHRIVTNCLDTGDPRYCARSPDPQAGYCKLDYPSTGRFATSRCAAARPASFTVWPRVEDPRRPGGIWRFAWDVAREHIRQKGEIALAVNPPELRTKDQLHLHLVRLLPDARPRVDALRPIKVEGREEVWSASTEHASSRQLASSGVIPIRGRDGGWLVAAVGGSPEGRFTRSRCVA